MSINCAPMRQSFLKFAIFCIWCNCFRIQILAVLIRVLLTLFTKQNSYFHLFVTIFSTYNLQFLNLHLPKSAKQQGRMEKSVVGLLTWRGTSFAAFFLLPENFASHDGCRRTRFLLENSPTHSLTWSPKKTFFIQTKTNFCSGQLSNRLSRD